MYYWTESYTLSATQFAREVSRRIGKSISASDVSACARQSDLDSKRKIALEFIYIGDDDWAIPFGSAENQAEPFLFNLYRAKNLYIGYRAKYSGLLW